MKKFLTLIIILILTLGFQNINEAARSEFAQIEELIISAKQMPPEQAINALNEAVYSLNKIADKYPVSNIAIEIAANSPIDGISINSIKNDILELYQQPLVIVEDKVFRFNAIFSNDGSKIYALGTWLLDKNDTSNDSKSYERNIRTFDVNSNNNKTYPLAYQRSLLNGRFSLDNKRAIFRRSNLFELWDVENNQIVKKIKDKIYSSNDMVFSPDGEKLLMAYRYRGIYREGDPYLSASLWDTQTGKKIKEFGKYKESMRAVFSPDGRKIATFSSSYQDDGLVRIWDVETGEIILILKGHERGVTSAEFSPDGSKILTSSYYDGSRLWETESGKVLKIFAEPRKDFLVNAIFSPDASTILNLFWGSPDKLYDAKTGELIRIFDGLKEKNIVDDDEGLKYASFSPEGNKVLITSNKVAYLWDVNTGKIILDYFGQAEKPPFHLVLFSPDGTKFISSRHAFMETPRKITLWGVPPSP